MLLPRRRKPYPSNGFLFLGSHMADDVAHDTKKESIAGAQEGINSKGNVFDIEILFSTRILIFANNPHTWS